MKKVASASALAVLAIAATHASAQMVYDTFEYGSSAIGTPLGNTNGSYLGYTNPMNGQNWFDVGTTGTPTMSPSDVILNSGSLALTTTGTNPTTPVPTGGGDSVSFADNETASRSPKIAFFPGVSSGWIYYSLTLRVSDITGLIANTTGGFLAGFNNTTAYSTSPVANPSTVLGRLQIRRDPANPTTNYQVGVRPNVASGSLAFSGSFLPDNGTTLGDVVFVVVGVNPVSGGQDTKIWINPSADTLGQAAPPAPTLETTGGTDPAGGLSSFVLREGNTALPKGIIVDDVRIDRNWAQVAPAAGATWTGASGGTWSSNSNWSTNSAPGATSGQFVNLYAGGGAIAVSGTQTVGTLNIKSSTPYSVSGGTLSFDGSTVNVTTSATDVGDGTINVYAPIDAVTGAPIPATHTITSNVVMPQPLTANIESGQTLAFTSSFTTNNNLLTKNGSGTLQVPSVVGNVVSIEGGSLKTAPTGTPDGKPSSSTAGTSVVNTLTITATGTGTAAVYLGKFDLTDNALIVKTDGVATNSMLSYVTQSYAGGAWTGNGIGSSYAAANGHTGIAVAQASNLLGASGGTFAGQTVSGSDTLLLYTWYGDVNMNGVIDADDYAVMDRQIAKGGINGGAHWTDGDFNYDGNVNSSDLGMLDAAYAASGGTFSPEFLASREAEFGPAYVNTLLASVPEPASLSLLALPALSLLRRRSRR